MTNSNGNGNGPVLYAHRMGIDTYKQPIIFLRRDSQICRSEGFESMARIQVVSGTRTVIATLNTVGPEILEENRVGLSEFAWKLLEAREGDVLRLFHQDHLESLSYVRSKIFGHKFNEHQLQAVVRDIARGSYSDIHLSSFVTACSGGKLDTDEILSLTQAMITVGDKINWPSKMIVDKHCVGGLPGNRTTMIVVPIVAAFGLMIPKTSSRAITSPAGTADTMEVLSPVKLRLSQMRKVVEKEGGCIAWGGAADLSPADDILIRIERALNLDNEGQLVASVLSKKVSAGSTHVLIDMPIGPTAKIRGMHAAEFLRDHFMAVAHEIGLTIETVFSDGSKPVGRGIGPALEARDVLAVLQNEKDAPQDLRDRSLELAGKVLEFSPDVAKGTGLGIATEILDNGKAWTKFLAICEAQGGFFEPTIAKYKHVVTAPRKGKVLSIDNRRIATVAKLAGAPHAKAAGIDLHVNVDGFVEAKQPLYTIYSETPGELDYAIKAIRSEDYVMKVV
ncbi:MAG: thymidine phosphorylase family protein [Gammaproteobacteria bacterium]|nr:thymidine phosphorylase family protein [Gammaproteobacteria bacterium]